MQLADAVNYGDRSPGRTQRETEPPRLRRKGRVRDQGSDAKSQH